MRVAWIDSSRSLAQTSADTLPNSVQPISASLSANQYLLDRLGEHCQEHGIPLEVLQLSELDLDRIQYVDRIVLNSHTRSDYPLPAIETLTQAAVGIPWGVVMGHWHIGSRRSGLGVLTHWSQPWFRWWESWRGWFFPESARPTACCDSQFDAVTTTNDMAMIHAPRLEANHHNLQLLLYCGCAHTRQAWQQMVLAVGGCVHCPGATAVDDSCDSEPDFVLWDDSLLTCLPDVDIRAQAMRQLSRLHQRYSHVPLLAGLSQCHLDLWSDIRKSGTSEVFVKPSYGLPLADYLVSRVSRQKGIPNWMGPRA